MSNGYSGIRFERLGAVLRVTVDNPRSELNTVDAEMHGELARLFWELRREDEARAIVLTGSGRCSGGAYDDPRRPPGGCHRDPGKTPARLSG